METVFCECKKCDAPIGRFVNLWTQIGKSYFSPVVEPEDDLAIQCKGPVRIGERGTLVEECHLQDIVCSNCAALIGLRCIQTPVNHVLDENQLLLRLASVELLDSDGQEIEFAIKRVLSVDEPSKVNDAKFPDAPKGSGFTSAFPGAVELQQLKNDLHSQREDIRRIDCNGFRIVSALDKRADRIDGEVSKLKDTMGGVHRDVGGLQKELGSIRAEIGEMRASTQNTSALVKLEDRLTTASNMLGEIRQQITAVDTRSQKEISKLKSELSRQQQDMEDLRSKIRDGVTAADYTQDLGNLHGEMVHLRRQLEETRAHGMGRVETAFSPRELEVLTSNIAKIGNRANQVETLQMELEILKGRIERAETTRQAVGSHRPTRTIDAVGPLVYSDLFPGKRKRIASPSIDHVPKRSASSAGYANFADRRYATPPSWPANSPATDNQEEGPENDSSHSANFAKRGKKSPPCRTTSTTTGISTRLRNR